MGHNEMFGGIPVVMVMGRPWFAFVCVGMVPRAWSEEDDVWVGRAFCAT